MDGSGVYDQLATIDGNPITPWGPVQQSSGATMSSPPPPPPSNASDSPPVSPIRSPAARAAASLVASPIHPLDAGGRQWRQARQAEPPGNSTGLWDESLLDDPDILSFRGSNDEYNTESPLQSVRSLPAMFETQPLASLEELRAQEARARRTVHNATIALRVQQALRFQREADRLFMLPVSAGFRGGASFASNVMEWLALFHVLCVMCPVPCRISQVTLCPGHSRKTLQLY